MHPTWKAYLWRRKLPVSAELTSRWTLSHLLGVKPPSYFQEFLILRLLCKYKHVLSKKVPTPTTRRSRHFLVYFLFGFTKLLLQGLKFLCLYICSENIGLWVFRVSQLSFYNKSMYTLLLAYRKRLFSYFLWFYIWILNRSTSTKHTFRHWKQL